MIISLTSYNKKMPTIMQTVTTHYPFIIFSKNSFTERALLAFNSSLIVRSCQCELSRSATSSY